MPFTPTHILAILPITAVKHLRLPFSALVIGSMIPDFPLFVPLSPTYDTTHSVPGILTACLPLGLTWFLVFQLLMKRPLFALLPEAIRSRCLPQVKPCVEPGARFFASASLAIMAGAATHLFWDSFTHRGRWGTQLFPRLNEAALTIDGHAVPGYKLLQYGSTLVGLPCLLLLLARRLHRQAPGPLDGYPVLSPPISSRSRCPRRRRPWSGGSGGRRDTINSASRSPHRELHSWSRPSCSAWRFVWPKGDPFYRNDASPGTAGPWHRRSRVNDPS